MIALTALFLAMLAPGRDVAPINCSDYRDHGANSLGVVRFLSPSGRFVGESLSWGDGDPGGARAGAHWTLPPGPRLSPQLDLLAFTFYLPQAPDRRLRARVEADGREVARLQITPSVEAYRSQHIVIVRLMRPPYPGLPPDGPLPRIGAARRLSMTLEALDGRVLGTVPLTLPDWQAVAPTIAASRAAAAVKAQDYGQACYDHRVPSPMPVAPQGS